MKPLEKIVETLIINGTLAEQAGLFYGKTGIAVFFFYYAMVIFYFHFCQSLICIPDG